MFAYQIPERQTRKRGRLPITSTGLDMSQVHRDPETSTCPASDSDPQNLRILTPRVFTAVKHPVEDNPPPIPTPCSPSPPPEQTTKSSVITSSLPRPPSLPTSSPPPSQNQAPHFRKPTPPSRPPISSKPPTSAFPTAYLPAKVPRFDTITQEYTNRFIAHQDSNEIIPLALLPLERGIPSVSENLPVFFVPIETSRKEAYIKKQYRVVKLPQDGVFYLALPVKLMPTLSDSRKMDRTTS